MKIKNYEGNVINAVISIDIPNPNNNRVAHMTFFECDGEEFMFRKSFRRKGNYTLPVFKTYLIKYSKTNSEDYKYQSMSFINPPFELVLVK